MSLADKAAAQEKRIADLETEIKSLKAAREAGHVDPAAIAELKAQVSVLNKKLDEALAKNKGIEGRIRGSTERLNELNATIAAEKARAAKANAASADLDSKIKSGQTDLSAAEEHGAEERAKFHSTMGSGAKSQAELTAELKALQYKSKLAGERLEDINNQVAAAKKLQEEAEKTAAEADAKSSALRGEIEKLGDAANLVLDKVSEKDKQIQQLKTQLSSK
eukprot:TRINITY_DN28412_c0_g1_i2.p1 TRINITY_DN28412_c0_g1~~TRINITY_DN28412_c0_g1_i2.p1  ORF type:complete len:221 (+),score=77.12 TRINITY_DN28412_c0_g1_i2:20-682(+)